MSALVPPVAVHGGLMAKINLSDEEKLKLIAAVNKGVEPTIQAIIKGTRTGERGGKAIG